MGWNLAWRSGPKKPNFTPIGAARRPCGVKNLKIALWVTYIPALCTARNAAGNKARASEHVGPIYRYWLEMYRSIFRLRICVSWTHTTYLCHSKRNRINVVLWYMSVLGAYIIEHRSTCSCMLWWQWYDDNDVFVIGVVIMLQLVL